MSHDVPLDKARTSGGVGGSRRYARARRRRGLWAGAEAAEHAGVVEADGAGGRLYGGALADEVLGTFQPEGLLVAQRGEAGGLGEQAGEGTVADPAGGRQVGQRELLGETGVDEVLGA